MWLFNYISINNLLLSLLVIIMTGYFATRGEKSRELSSLVLFMIMVILWQLCLLFNNTLNHPYSAYPLFYFQNSGYTALSFLGLVMFSYYFIEPVFPRERKAVFIILLLFSFSMMFHALFVEFPRASSITFNPVIDAYSIRPTPLRKYIIMTLVAESLLVVKNLVYKTIMFKGDSRRFALKVFIVAFIGISMVPLTALLGAQGRLDENIASTIGTFVASIILIYFFWTYIDYSRIRFFYSDKTRLIILFLVVIIISVLSSFTYIEYKNAYFRNLESLSRQVAFDVAGGNYDPRYYERRYGGSVEFITVMMTGNDAGLFLLGRQQRLAIPAGKGPDETLRHEFKLKDRQVRLFYYVRSGGNLIEIGFPYSEYRAYIHRFASIGFFTVIFMVVGMFFLLRFLVTLSLLTPLRGLMNGIEELQRGNLDHRIELHSLDEIGYISQQFNYMLSDLKASGDGILQSERKYRELTAMLPDIVYETDMDLNITYLNDAGCRLTGYSEADVKQGLSLASLMTDLEAIMLRKMIKIQEEDPSLPIFTHQIRRKDGSFFFGENNPSVINSGGVSVGMRGVIRDVTEKMRLEQRLIHSQKMEIIGSLAGGIAHDFNNILGGIVGSISLLDFRLKEHGTCSAEDLADDIRTLKISAERAMRMVDRILSISRRQRLSLEVTDLKEIADHVQEICKNTFDRKIELDFGRCPAGECVVLGDATQLEQVLLNLCINAHDAMTIMRGPEEEQRGTLSVHLSRFHPGREFLAKFPDASDQEYVCARVSDTGVGIDPGNQERIFDPFFTTKEKNKGTGLGLAMVYNIVRQHSGFIDMESHIDAGTRFSVYLPFTREAAASGPAGKREPEHSHGQGTILLVEDDPAIQKTTEKILKLLGYGVILAENGQRGIELYRERHAEIRAVILDMIMPKRSGNEVFPELVRINPAVRVLVSSGFRNDPRIEEVLDRGARGFLQKPYTIEQLSKELSRILAGENGAEK